MNDRAKEVLAIKEKLESIQAKKNKILGKKEQLIIELQKLDCSSLDEAYKKSKKLEKEIDILESDFNERLENFEEKYNI